MTLHAPNLSALSGIRHAFFTRKGGVSGGIYESLNGGVGSKDQPPHIAENRKRMAEAIGVSPERFITAYQIHSPEVVIADKPWDAASRPKADAIVTKTPGLGIGVTTADCGPVLFADPQARVVGAAHAGWRGAFGGVLEAAIEAMESLGAKRERIVVALGPMIRQPNYEVSADFMDKFIADHRGNARLFMPAKREGHALFNLPGYIAARLVRANVTRIEDTGHCTYADPSLFFSYRRSQHRAEADYGRHVNAIALVD